MYIKKEFEKTDKLYHFTSFDTALKIIESNRLRFGRLNNMNDLHENDKLCFVDSTNQNLNHFPSEELDALYDEIYKYRQISFSMDRKDGKKEGFDLHQMWGNYADKGKGVCLVFDKKELEKSNEIQNIYHGDVIYNETQDLDSFVVSKSQTPNDVSTEIAKRLQDLFFHKRKEWEHELEYRFIKRCPNYEREEYFHLGHALKFVILSTCLRDIDKVLYFKRLETIKALTDKVKDQRNKGDEGKVPILVYGNGLLDYSLDTFDGSETIWNSIDGYNILIIGKNYQLDLTLCHKHSKLNINV